MADESDFDGFNEFDIGSDIEHQNSSDIEVSDVSSVSSVSHSESDGDNLPNDDDWTHRLSRITVHDFVGESGPNLPPAFDVNTATPLDYFNLMFDPEMFTTMTRHTNNFARWKMDQADKEDPNWVDTTPQELRAFVGINIMMGINRLPATDMYWSEDPYVGNAGISSTMPINRYQKVNQYFHVSNRSTERARGQPGYDRLYKVRPVLENVAGNFLQHYRLSQELAVDEAMVKYTGRLSFKQYMPAKPIKRGIKIWMACDSNSSFLSRFQVYLGRATEPHENGLGYSVVTSLTDNLHHSNRRVYFDNFFSGIPLLQGLEASGLYGCGTVRVNRRGFPPELKKPRTVKARGEMMVMQKGASNLTATVWKDKRLVHHLTTCSQPTLIQDATRRIGQHRVALRQPDSVHQYNKFMGGVDQHDQLRMAYDVGRNSKKWWRYLFWFFINCAVVNAFILYRDVSKRRVSKKRFTHLDFRMELACDIIGGFTSRKRRMSNKENVGIVLQENLNGGAMPVSTTCTCSSSVHRMYVYILKCYSCTSDQIFQSSNHYSVANMLENGCDSLCNLDIYLEYIGPNRVGVYCAFWVPII